MLKKLKSDQDMIKDQIMDELGEEAVTTKCEMTHTNRSRKKTRRESRRA